MQLLLLTSLSKIPVFGPKSRKFLDFLANNHARRDLDPLLSTQFFRQEFNSLNFSTRLSRLQSTTGEHRGRILSLPSGFSPKSHLIFINRGLPDSNEICLLGLPSVHSSCINTL